MFSDHFPSSETNKSHSPLAGIPCYQPFSNYNWSLNIVWCILSFLPWTLFVWPWSNVDWRNQFSSAAQVISTGIVATVSVQCTPVTSTCLVDIQQAVSIVSIFDTKQADIIVLHSSMAYYVMWIGNLFSEIMSVQTIALKRIRYLWRQDKDERFSKELLQRHTEKETNFISCIVFKLFQNNPTRILWQ